MSTPQQRELTAAQPVVERVHTLVAAGGLKVGAMTASPLCVLGVKQAGGAKKVSTLGLRGHDDEIEIYRNVVTWRAGGCTQKTYTLQPEGGHVIEVSPRPHSRFFKQRRLATSPLTRSLPPPLQATWCQFSCQGQNASSKFSLCALQSELITIFESDGPVHAVPLPFRASRLWPACDGIIIERQGGEEQAPEELLLFSLLHPLEELRPLHFAPAPSGEGGAEIEEVSPRQRVLFSSTQVAAPLLVTLHEESETMVVWVTRQRTVHAMHADSFSYIDDSSATRPDYSQRTDYSVRSVIPESTEDVDMVVEVVLEEVWSEKLTGQGPPETIFVSNDWRGELLLCFVFASSKTLRTLQVACKVIERGLPLFKLTRGDTVSNVVAAAPVQGTGRPCLVDTEEDESDTCTDLLALDTSGTLALYAGDRRLCTVPCLSEIGAAYSSQLEDGAFYSPQKNEEGSFVTDSVQLLGLRDAVANRVSLECSNGGLYRVSLEFGVTSPVVSACLMAMQDCTVLPQTLTFSLRTDTIRCSHNQANAPRSLPDSDDVEWSTFCRIVLTLVDEVLAQARESCGEPEPLRNDGAEASPIESSKKKQRASSRTSLASSVDLNSSDGSALGDLPADDSDWETLVASDYHRGHPAQSVFDQLASHHPTMGGDVSSIQMRQGVSGTDAAPASPSSPTGEEPEPESDSDAHCSWLASLSTSSADFGQHVTMFMQVIHLVYEDLKLDVLTSSERMLRPLATLLHKLARRLNLRNHVDHYVRDFGEIFAVPGMGQAPTAVSEKVASHLAVDKLATAPVPSIYRWLHSCVRSTPDHSLAVSGMSAHGTMGSELCHATRKVCFLYQLLVEGNAARQFAIRRDFGMSKSEREMNASKRLHKGILRSVSAVLFEGQHGGLNATMQAAAPPASPIDEGSMLHTASSNPDSDGCEVLGRVSRTREAATVYTASSVHEKVVLGMVSVELTPADLDCLPIAVAIPLRESLWACRHQPPPRWPPVAYELMGREDLACSTGESSELSRASSSMATLSMPSQPVARSGQPGGLPFLQMGSEVDADGAPAAGTPVVCDGTELDTQLPHLRFGRDQRLKEVQRVMRSSRPGALRIVRAPETNDHEFLEQQQKKLQLQAQRTMSIPVGRGMFTLFTARMTVTDPLPIPALNLSGRLPLNNAVVGMDTTSLPSDLQKWPDFHNGLAAGLRIPPQQSHATRTWIVYNKPDTLTDEHAGVLMALGLTGQLSSLASADLVWYLSQRHDTTAVGVMLGMAAARRGSMDNTISKMLCMHILAFHPPTFPELDVSSNLQTAAIMGIALLYQGTANRFMTEVLLGEIGRRASDSISVDREGYSLAAGIALGFVTLGRGNGAAGLADLRIEDRLRRFMTGGKDPDASTGASAANYASQAQCSRIKEGEVVNVDITAPAATLALGLMYLRTNNVAVGEQLSIPDTHFLLDYVRPDFILLRVLAKNLVLWDSIEPTEAWAQKQIPAMIQTALAAAELPNSQKDDEIDHETMDMEAVRHAHWNIIAGVCLSLGLRFAGQADLRAQQLLLTYIRYFQVYATGRGPGGVTLSNLDKPIMETCFNVVILSLSLVMAGTGHLETFRLFRRLRKRSAPELTYGNHMAVSMAIGFLFLGGGCATLHTSNEAIGALVAALYPRFPLNTRDNRYHLQAFRHLYVLAVEPRFIETRDVDTNEPVYVPLKLTLRKRRKRSAKTKLHSTVSTASAMDTSADTSAAGGWRGVPCNISDDEADDTDKSTGADDTEEMVVRRISPCLLPEVNRLVRVEVETPRYWPVVLHLTPPEDDASSHTNGDGTTATPPAEKVWKERRIIYVKRKTGYLPYADDPHGVRSILARPFPKDGTERNSAGMKAEFVRAFSADPNVLAFVTHFCGAGGRSSAVGAPSHTGLLYECLTRNKPEMLSVYMSLSQIVRDLPHARSCEGLWNLKLLFAYYDYRWGVGNQAPPGPGGTVSSEAGAPPPVRSGSTFDGDASEDASEPLIQLDFQAWLRASVDRYFEEGEPGLEFLSALKHYTTLSQLTIPPVVPPVGAPSPAATGGGRSFGITGGPLPMDFAAFLVYFDVPPPTVLTAAIEGSGLLQQQDGSGGVSEASGVVRLAGSLDASVPVAATLKLAKAWTVA